MILVILSAILAVCGAAKLDRSYLPPISAKTAGGSPGDLQAPVDGLPSGSYTNDAQGVVVDAATPGTRTSGAEPTGLGGSRTSYGSTNSKVGDAAFRGSLTGFGNTGGPNTRIAPGFGSTTGANENAGGPSIRIAPGFSSIIASGGTDDDKTRTSTLKFSNEIGLDDYSYGFETDNGISIGENGVANDGIKAHGEYSYKGDDGKVYSVSYTADEGGYRPQGSHLPTSPPIPDEILKSLEQNAKEEAAGIVDDGTYNAQMYNDEGDYTSNNGDGNNNRPSVSGGDATASGSFVSHSNQGIKHSLGGHGVGSYQPGSAGQGSHGFGSHAAGNKQTGSIEDSASSGVQHGHAPHFGQNQLGAKPQFGVQATGPQRPNVESGFHSHTNQNRFGVQTVNPSSATAFTSTKNGQGLASPTRTPSLHSHPGHRLPGSSDSNTAYSSASTTGSGSASAFASTGSVGTGFKKQYPNTGSTGSPAPGSKFGSDSTGGASFSNFEAINPNDPSTASASASAQGQGASAEALSTSSPSFGGSKFNKAPVSTHSTFGSNAYSQNAQANGLTINEYLPPVNIVESTGQVPHGSNAYGAASSSSFPSSAPVSPISSAGKPNQTTNLHGTDAATAASNFGSQQPGFSSPSSFNSRPGQYTQTDSTFPTGLGQSQFPNANVRPSSAQTTQPTFGFPSAATPTNVPITGQLPSITPTQPNISLPSQQINNFGSNFPSHSGQYKPQTTQGSYAQTGSNDANFSPSSPKPTLSQQQGSDSSYYYNPPAKPFVTPISQYQTAQFPSNSAFGSSAISSSGQNSNNRPSNAPIASLSQHGSKYSNTPIIGAIATTTSPQNGQYQGSTDSSYYNGITQASISPFPSATPTLATQFGSQSSQFESKPTTQSGGSSSQAHFGSTENQQAFGQKPIVQSQSQYSQSSSSQTDNNHKPSQQGTLYEYNKPPSTSELVTSTQTDSQSKPIQTSFGSQSQFGNQQLKPFGSNAHANYFQHSEIQGSTFGSKPSNQFVKNPQSSQNVGSISTFQSQSGQPQTGQKPFSSSQIGSNYQQSQFGSSSGSSFGNKPSIQSGSQQSPLGSSVSQVGQNSFTSQTDGQQNQGTLYEYNKPDANLPSDKEEIVQGSPGTSGSQPSQGSTSTSGTQGFGSSQTGFPSQQTQFGAPTGQKPHTGLQSAAHSCSSTSQQIKPISQFGSQSTHTQFGQKPQTTIGSSYTPNTGDNAESGKKPFSTSQTGSSCPHSQTTFGSQQTQFGQKPLTNQVTGFGNSQSGYVFQQNQLGSALGSQIGQKPQSSQGSGITSAAHTSQYGNKPVGSTQTGSIFPQSQTTFGSQQPTQFGQKPLTNQVASFGSSGTGSQTQFGPSPGSQLVQSTQATGSGSTDQTSQFGKKPFGATQTGSTYQQTQTQQTTQFGKKPLNQGTGFGSSQPGTLQQGTQGSSFATSVLSQDQASQFSTKPNSQFGTSFPSHFVLKPNQGSSLTSNSQPSQFGQNPLSNTQTGFSSGQSQFGSNTGSKFEQKPQTTQFGQQSFGSPQTGNQIGSLSDSKFGQNSQTTQGTGTISQTATSFGQKPLGSSQTGSSLQQTAFGSLSGSQFSQKPQTTQGSAFGFSTPSKDQSVQTTQFGLKPFSSSQTTGSSFSQTHVGSNSGSQFGQNQQPTGTVSQTATPFGQNPTGISQISYQQSQFGSTSTSHFGQNPLSNSGSKGQSVHITQFNVKPISSSQTSFSQTQFDSNTGSAFGQKPLSGVGTKNTTQIKPISQYGSKPFGSQSFQGTQQQTQYGSSTISKYGQNTGSQGQLDQTSQSGQQPSSSFPGSSFTQTHSSSSSGSQFGQKPQVQPISQFGTKPFGSQFIQGSVQQSQHGLFAGSQPAQNLGNQGQTGQIQFSQKPFGSSQATGSTFQQAQSGQTESQFGQKPTLGSQISSSVVGQSAQSQFDTQSKKPFDNTQSPFQSQFGSTTGQKKPQNSASAFASSSGSFGGTQFGQGSKHQTTSFSSVGTQPQRPLGSSQTQTGQYTQTTGQFGTQSQKPFGSSPSIFQQSQFPGQKPFGNQGSTFQNGQALDQKTQPIQSGIQTSVTSVSSQSSGQSFGNVGSFEGYNYQKPHSISSTPSTLSAFEHSQSTIGSSQFGVQPTKPSDLGTPFGSQTNQPQFNGQSFNSISTVATPVTSFTQFGVHPTKPTIQFTGQPFKPYSTPSNQISIEQLQSAFPTSQFGVQPTQGAIVANQQPSQTSGAYNQPIKTNVYGNTQSTSLPSLGLGATDSLNQGSSVSTVQTPISILEGNKQNSFVGKGEEFGGPRDPPKFDDKTGYHY